MALIISTTALAIPLRDAMDTYLQENCTEDSHTGRAKRHDLRLFLEYLEENLDPETPFLYDLTAKAVNGFLDARAATEAPTTLNRRLASLRHFSRSCEHLFRDYRCSLDSVRPFDITPPQPLSFTDEELAKLRGQALLQPDRFRAFRALLVIELGSAMGLRCAEMCNLRIGHVTESGIYISGKGKKHRELPIRPRVRAAWQAYLPHRADVGPPLAHLPLLCASWPRHGHVKRLNEKTVYTLIRELGDACGVANAHPHRLRHTFVRLLLDATGNNLPLVAYAARHSNVQTTMRYRTPFRTEIEQAFQKMDEDDAA